ncbi:MAG: SMP-30/gluconolactonase/LRE family protein, partial [Planctomycetales bacterium]
NSRADGAHQLLSFDVAADRTLKNKKVLWDFGPNRRGIDGMALDVEGNIYATAGRGEKSGIYVFNPQGKPLALIATPGPPTNCAFGDKDRKTLYITAAGTNGKYSLYRVRLAKAGYLVFPPGP